MDERYWDEAAADYDGTIFNSFGSASSGILLRRLDDYADPSARAADAGCGVGKYLPALASRFAHVDAYDLSAKLLSQARRAADSAQNVRYHKRDFASPRARVNPVDFALCTNVLIMAAPSIREQILHTIGRLVRPGGVALFLMPSLESALLTHRRMVEWHRGDGLNHDNAERLAATNAARSGRNLLRGLVPLDGEPTKHHLKEEAIITLRQFGFEPLHFDKVEYGWETEFAEPPAWMQDPFPWDWLVAARRRE